MMRNWLVIPWLALIFTAIGYIFWQNELVYSLPTPVPENYHSVKQGETIHLDGKLASAGKPLFIHFFNPSCPCSRFNLPHFKSLVKKYNDRIAFAIVVMSKEGKATPEEIQDQVDLKIPVCFDQSIAQSCGVYSTPQAVIIDAQGKLYYRGNYNKSRYCTDRNSNFAEMAIDSLLNRSAQPLFNQLALTSYGCVLPECKK